MVQFSTDPSPRKYARFTLKALADAKCEAIKKEQQDSWNGLADAYAIPIKKGNHWYLPVLPGFESYFKGMKLYSID